jgi:hypothetical protein
MKLLLTERVYGEAAVQEVYIEKRRRGFFGWVFLLVFLGWNALMVVWLLSYAVDVSGIETMNAAEETGKNIGVSIAVSMILVIWALGSIITGILALLTRGSKTVVKRANR